MATKDYQGGKAFGAQLKQQNQTLDSIADEFRSKIDDATIEKYKNQFISYDINNSGDIDLMELKMMMEKLGQTKTHLELKKMIQEVDSTGTGTINFRDFLIMMTGKPSILQRILMFEEMTKKPETPKGPPPKKSIADFL